jgi:dTDP-4-dehydrorhamnose reductase
LSGTEIIKSGGNHLRIDNAQMTWLITGGTGQLGIAVSQELSKRGILLRAFGSQDLDVTKATIVHDLVSKLSPNVIVNCAAWTDVDGAETNELKAVRVNVDGTKNIALAAKNCRAKLIHVSTDYVFSDESNSPRQISDIVNPQSAYGRTKAEGERRVFESYSDNSLIVRTAWLYSPWGKNFVKTMAGLALSGNGDVRVVNDQTGQPTSATDLAKQLIELGLSSLPAGIYHGTNSGEATWFDLAQEVFKLVGADENRVVPVPSNEHPRPAKRPSYSVLSHDEWAKTTLKPMRDWKTALEEAMPAIIKAVGVEE